MNTICIKFSKFCGVMFCGFLFYIGYHFIPVDNPCYSMAIGILLAYMGTILRWKNIEVENNTITIHYFTRFFNRKHKYKFSDVVLVRYEHAQSIGSIPFFLFVFKTKQSIPFLKKRYYFMITTSSGNALSVKEILQVFKDKGCAYEIKGDYCSEFEPD